MSTLIREANDDDLVVMEGEIREIDRMEFDVMSGGKSVSECLDHLIRRSNKARAIYIDGNLVAIYGVLAKTLTSSEGNPWLAATTEIEKPGVRREFAKQTKPQIVWASQGFDHLWNLVAAENKIAIRWLKWIGFIFDGTSYSVSGHKFLKFHIGG